MHSAQKNTVKRPNQELSISCQLYTVRVNAGTRIWTGDRKVPEIVQSLLSTTGDYGPILVEYGLIIIFVAIVIDGFGIPAPSQSLLIAGAILSSNGEWDIRLLLASAWVAAVVGSSLGYIVGRVGGRKLLLRLPLSSSRFARMEAFCQRYGKLLVVLSRFIDGPRQLTGVFVGSLQMPVLAFLLATSAGAVLWVGFWGIGSYYLGRHFHVIARVFESVAPFAWLATGFLALAFFIYLMRRKNHENPTAGK